jgi:NAD(P)-dependent dehydrogenase (short-subunit alcohol dehydrogenase family)
MLLEDKVSIISGVGPGLGTEMANVFAREGAHVVLAARTASKLEAVKDQMAKDWPKTRVLTCPTDIGDKAQTQRLVDATLEEFGRLDVLVNSAVLTAPLTMFEEADLDEWRHAYDVTVFGTLQLTQQAIVPMKAAGKGSIVFVNSMIQKKPLPMQSGYGSSKGSLTVAARFLAKELGQYGIRVNSAFMGWMWGPSVEGYIDSAAGVGGNPSREEMIAAIAANIPIGRIPEDGECANAVAFLASDLASVITGAELNVNGGEVML